MCSASFYAWYEHWRTAVYTVAQQSVNSCHYIQEQEGQMEDKEKRPEKLQNELWSK